MRLYDRVASRLEGRRRAVPVPAVAPWQEAQPYSTDQYAPDLYGDYLATSNDVYSCAWLRAKNLAKLHWLVYDNAGKEQDETAPLPSLLRRPNPWMTSIRVKAHVELCLAIWGRAVLLLERGSANPATLPREIWPVKPTLVKPVPHRTEFITGFVYTPPGGAQPIPLRPDEVIEILYPNPADWYAPLPPMAAVRLAAETASEAMRSNRQLFRQGMTVGGFAMPPDKDSTYTVEQAQELEQLIARRFSGTSNAHRWQVLRYFLNLKDMAVTPKDAEWINGANLTFRQVCRGMGVPPALVGDSEYATLANLRVYERALWEHTMEFETELIGAELTRQLCPVFASAARIILDLSDVVALQEDETEKWAREKDQIDRGALTINEWRIDQGWEPVPWGDSWWAPLTVAPIQNEERPPTAAAATVEAQTVRANPARLPRADYQQDEDGLASDLAAVMQRQLDSILRLLKQGEASRTVSAALDDPFDLPRWRERTRAACHARFVAATERSMISEARLLNMTPEQLADLLADRATRAAIEGNVQAFAHHVSTTTYNQVKATLSQGVRKGEDLEQLARRVRHVMGIRVEDARRIAQTEVTRSVTTGQLAAYQVAGVPFKRWVTVGDDLVRDTHRAVGGTTIPVGALFTVGAGSGFGPGRIGVPEEDINCRCWLEPVMEV